MSVGRSVKHVTFYSLAEQITCRTVCLCLMLCNKNLCKGWNFLWQFCVWYLVPQSARPRRVSCCRSCRREASPFYQYSFYLLPPLFNNNNAGGGGGWPFHRLSRCTILSILSSTCDPQLCTPCSLPIHLTSFDFTPFLFEICALCLSFPHNAKDFMLMLGLNETIDQLAISNSVCRYGVMC